MSAKKNDLRASTPVVLNTILWNNSSADDSEVTLGDSSTVILEYSSVTGGRAGLGVINSDPLFVSNESGDFRLQDSSPLIEAGSNVTNMPVSDILGNPRPTPVGSVPDMGAIENTN